MSKNTYTCDCATINEEAVLRTASQMPESDTLKALADFFSIMGDSTRCRIICALSIGEMCVCDIANVLSMTKSSISHQLSKMREAGVVKCRREGKTVLYSLDDGHVEEIFSLTLTHISHKKGEIK